MAVTFPEADLSGALARMPQTPAKASASGPALTAFPNPSAGSATVTLRAEEGSEATVAVYDALGRRVAVLHDGEADGVLELRYDGAALAPGVYVVRVRTEAGVTARSVTAAR